MSDWRATWRPMPDVLWPLPLTKTNGPPGEVGLADFPAGTYPACSLHGAMNRVTADKDWWRCLTCNNGSEWHR